MAPEKDNGSKAESKATGTYVYDKKLKKVVKVSEDIPKHGKHKHFDGCGCQQGGGCCGGNCGLE